MEDGQLGTYQSRIVEQGSMSAQSFAERFRQNPLNWKSHGEEQDEAVDGVLSDIGWVTGLIANVRTGLILDGHERLSLALRNGSTVPYTLVDLAVEEERQILATFDALGQMAKVRRDKHALLLQLVEDTATGRRDAVSQLMNKIATRRPVVVGESDAEPAERPAHNPREALRSPMLRGPELRFDKYAVPMTEDELSTLIALYQDYQDENGGKDAGFVAYLTLTDAKE